jgi:hypothetical protein
VSSLADPAGSLAPGASTPGWAKPAQSGDPGASTPARATAARSGNPGAARRHWLEMTHHPPFPSETNCIARNGAMIENAPSSCSGGSGALRKDPVSSNAERMARPLFRNVREAAGHPAA